MFSSSGLTSISLESISAGSVVVRILLVFTGQPSVTSLNDKIQSAVVGGELDVYGDGSKVYVVISIAVSELGGKHFIRANHY